MPIFIMAYNIENKKFGKLTAIKKVGRTGSNNIWECKCDCGNTTTGTVTSLMLGNKKSCGCFRKDLFEKTKEIFIGNKYGNILVTEEIEMENGRRTVIGMCECGVIKKYRASHLKYGKTISCGCYPEKNRAALSTKHGLSSNPLYFVWASMMDRCYNEKFQDYRNYGGRGISVCERWHNVTNFVADVTNGYKKGLQLDRVENNGNYCPENFRWATRKENNRNKRTNRMITVNGVTKSMAEWVEETGVKYTTMSGFVSKGGDVVTFISNILSNTV